MTTGHQPKPGATPPALPTTGSGVRPPAAAPAAQDAAQAIELAYGLLWRCGCDRRTGDGERLYQARQALLAQLDRDGQDRGITAAQALMHARVPEKLPDGLT
jgi:hypothetical protein